MSDKKVISLGGKEYVPPEEKKPEPVEAVVTFLEELLTLAKNGEVQEVSMTYNGSVGYYNQYVGRIEDVYKTYGMLNDLAVTYREMFICPIYEDYLEE